MPNSGGCLRIERDAGRATRTIGLLDGRIVYDGSLVPA